MTRWASLDMGTNTFRCLIAEDGGDGRLRELALLQEVVRIGEGIGGEGRLSEGARLRGIGCLKRFASAMDEYGAQIRTGVFTAAGRALKDAQTFRAEAEALLKADISVPTGEEEAWLSFDGALSLLQDQFDTALFLDIGGGSTEAASRTPAGTKYTSLPTGVVRIIEETPLEDPPTGEDHARLRQRARQDLGPSADLLDAANWRPLAPLLIATAGTPLTIAAHLTGRKITDTRGLTGITVDAGELRSVEETLFGMTARERASLPAMEKGREDVILAGLALLTEFMELFNARGMMVSDGGVLEGVLFQSVRARRGAAQWVSP